MNRGRLHAILDDLLDELGVLDEGGKPAPSRVRGKGALLVIPDPNATLPPPDDLERAEARRRVREADRMPRRGKRP